MYRSHLIAAALSTVLISGASGALAQGTMGEDKCMAVMMAMSKLEASMAGYADSDQAQAGLIELQPGLPAEISDRIEDLLDVALSAEGIEVGDPSHPMATGEFQKASRDYREALAPHCPSFDLDY
ncbi:hypothetical protein NHU_00840 [Rhodovulum sulfidophilum]|uniref:Uncharacterized protein n=1 Tax=Rhodovulum sulfidophilum TaxID=35806 RepID=A0A0D6AYL7_RHOSU|nr:hypothetical protein NHU_00840 [Rhodovulum sulfidophilum]